MQINEKDLEDLIFGSLVTAPESLKSIGFRTKFTSGYPHPNGIQWLRQVELKDYGRADIIGYGRFYGQIFVEIIELKNVPITSKDIEQIMRYRHAVSEIIKNSFKGHYYPEINMYLVGPSIESGHFLENHIHGLKLVTFSFSLTGFKFESKAGRWIRGNGELRFKDVRSGDNVIWRGQPAEIEEEEEVDNG